MSSAAEPLPGTSDLWEPELFDWIALETAARDVFHRYGYIEVRTPIFERTEVFTHNLGETTDVVQKEMYAFEDRGGRHLTLRPEGTAGVIRAIANKGLEQGEECRSLYFGPMFRGERPQAGRRRQFHQIGVEAVGSNTPWMDAECVAMLMHFLEEAGAGGGKLLINTRGLPSDRPMMDKALSDYFTPHIGEMCEDCRRRLESNVSRILDCKSPACQPIFEGAPQVSGLMSDESKKYFDNVCAALEGLGVPFEVTPRLVRGLDYYVHTVFEVVHPKLDKGADTLAGGGRYQISPPGMKGVVEGIGFACGMERLLLARASNAVKAEGDINADVMLVCLGEASVPHGLRLAQSLRHELPGLRIKADFTARSMKAQMRTANKVGASRVLILGENEIAQGVVVCKNMKDSTQETIALSEISGALKNI